MMNDEYYRIKNPQTVYDSDGSNYINVTCSHMSDTLRDNTITMEETLPVDIMTLMKRALQYRYTTEGNDMLLSAKNMMDNFKKNYTDAVRDANRLKVTAELDNATDDEKAAYEQAQTNANNAKEAYNDSVNWMANRTMEADKTSTPTLGWSVGEVTVDLSALRGLESVEDSIFNILLNIAEKYDGLLRFNSSDRTIDLLSLDTADSPVMDFSLSKNLKGVTINYDTSELVTKMYCFGNQDDNGVDLTIMDVNPTGRAYIENYEYFENLGYTTEDFEANPELFVKTSVWRDTNYYEDQRLYDDGIERLKKLATPIVSVSVSALDFTQIDQEDEFVNLKVGDPVKIIDSDNGMEFICFIVKRTVDYEERHIYNLELTNKIEYSTTLAKLFKRSAKTESAVTESGKINSLDIEDLAGLFLTSDMLPFYVACTEYPSEMKNGLLYLKYVIE